MTAPAGFVPDGFVPDAESVVPPKMAAAHGPMTADERANLGLTRSGKMLGQFSNLMQTGAGVLVGEPGMIKAGLEGSPASGAASLAKIMAFAPGAAGGATLTLTKSPKVAGMAAAGMEGGRQMALRSMGLPAPEGLPAVGRIAGEGALNTVLPYAGNLLESGIKAAAPPIMEQVFRGAAAVEKAFPQTSLVREALQRAIPVVRGSAMDPVATRASSSNALREQMFASAAKADEALAAMSAKTKSVPDIQPVPTKVWGATESQVPVTKTTFEPTQVPVRPPIQDVAHTFTGEVQAHMTIHDAAIQHGVDPEMLLNVVRDAHPRPLDLNELAKHGLDHHAVARLRGLTPLLDAADETRAAMQTVFRPSISTTMKTILRPTVRTEMIPGQVGMKDIPALRYNADQLATGVRDLLGRMKASTAAGADRAEIQGYLKNFLADHPGALSPTEADKIRAFAGTAAKNAIAGRQAAGAAATNATSPNWQLFNDAIQKTIRGRLAEDVGGLSAANAETQKLMALAKAYRIAESNMGPSLTHPVAAAAWRLGASPEGLSRLAIGAHGPLGTMLGQSPRLLSLLSPAVPDATTQGGSR